MKAYFGQYQRLRLHVADSNVTLVRNARKMLNAAGKARANRQARHEWLRDLMRYHREARKIARL